MSTHRQGTPQARSTRCCTCCTGIGGDETEWQRFAKPNVLLDNLIADRKATPMIVVMPNGWAQKDDRARGGFGSAPAFAAFEQDLLERRDSGN